MDSVIQSTEHSIPPLVHIPAPVVSRVLYGAQAPHGAYISRAAEAVGNLPGPIPPGHCWLARLQLHACLDELAVTVAVHEHSLHSARA